jgi:hypothetical protein
MILLDTQITIPAWIGQAIILSLIGGIALFFRWWVNKKYEDYLAYQKKHQNQMMYLQIQIEAMDAGLTNVNHGFGIEYKVQRDKKRDQLIEKYNFENDDLRNE